MREIIPGNQETLPPTPDQLKEKIEKIGGGECGKTEKDRILQWLFEQEITPNNLPVIRGEIAILREKKGLERDTLKIISWARKEAEKLESHEDVVDLWWEEYLVGKHMLMDARDKRGLENLPLKSKGMIVGFWLMRHSASNADEYIKDHGVQSKRGRSLRFIGEIHMIRGMIAEQFKFSGKKQYAKAIDSYRRAIELFRKSDNWDQRRNALEISGFLAEALVRRGKIKEGIDLAMKTFIEYDNIEEGKKLKEASYYTWAVWKSGCAIKLWHGLLAKRPQLNRETKERIIQMLEEAGKILCFPEDIDSENMDFGIRKNEIVAIKKDSFYKD